MKMASSELSPEPKILQWFIDTRRLWPVPRQPKSQDEVAALKTVVSVFSSRTIDI